MAESDEKVRHCDLAALRYCNSGSRIFFQTHQLDWDMFRKDGLPFEDFLKIEDSMVFRVIEQAKKRLRGEV